ncbi:hypothetical protein RCL1_008118 [Eukaryota sp. TZLM3-RCL]
MAKNSGSNVALLDSEDHCHENAGLLPFKEDTSLLTSFRHPNLVRYYHKDEQEANEMVFDLSEFGFFSDLDGSKQHFDAHDL